MESRVTVSLVDDAFGFETMWAVVVDDDHEFRTVHPTYEEARATALHICAKTGAYLQVLTQGRDQVIAGQREIVRQHRAACDVCIGGGDCAGPWGVWHQEDAR